MQWNEVWLFDKLCWALRARARARARVCEQTCNVQYCDYNFSLHLQMTLDKAKPDEIVWDVI